MKIYNNTNLNLKHKEAVIAVGNFDGVHLGHQKVLKRSKNNGKKIKIAFWCDDIRTYACDVF